MKTMKKFLMVLLGAALVLSMAGAVAALDQTTNSGTVMVNTTIADSYTVTIPEKVENVNAYNTASNLNLGGWINVTAIQIPSNLELNISISSVNGWNLKNTTGTNTNTYIPYAVYKAATVAENDKLVSGVADTTSQSAATKINTVTYLNAQTETMEIPLYFMMTAAPVQSGAYTDTMTISLTLDQKQTT